MLFTNKTFQETLSKHSIKISIDERIDNVVYNGGTAQ